MRGPYIYSSKQRLLIPAESAQAAVTPGDDQDAWDNATFVYTAEADEFGNYSVEEGDTFGVESVTELGSDTPMSVYDYTVFYMVDVDDNGELSSSDTVVNSADAIDVRPGGMPKAANASHDYLVVVVKGNLVAANGDQVVLSDGWAWSAYAGYGWIAHEQAFSVVEASKSLAGAVAFETKATQVDDVTKGELADSELVYTGNTVKFGFAVDGTVLEAADYSIQWIGGPADPSVVNTNFYNATNAGTYKAHIVGKGEYAGSEADVDVVISQLDLATMAVTAKDLDADDSTAVYTDASNFFLGTEQLAANATDIKVTPLDFTDEDGVKTAGFSGNMGKQGLYRYSVSAIDGSKNVTGSCIVNVRVFKNLTNEADFKYGETAINSKTVDLKYFAEFYLDRGQGFDPEMLNIAGDYDGFDYVVTKDGEPVESYDEPGVYEVTMTQDATADYSTGGSAKGSFQVVRTYVDYSNAAIFMFIDGVAITGSAPNDSVEYTGEAVVPTIVAKTAVKDGKVIDPSNYTVTYKKGGEAVESIVDPATDYSVEVEFADGTVATIGFKVSKATIESAKADADFFAIPADGSAAQPTFTGSTEKNFNKGQKFELAADQISVVYYEAEWSDNGTPADTSDDYWTKAAGAAPIAPEDLTEAGDYMAEINVLTTCATLQGSGVSTHVKVSETAVYSDVDANAWYAEYVYKAASDGFGYMTGIPGTSLFLPDGQITRAEVAQIVFNMAGGEDDPTDAAYPTRFADVVPTAWYAQAILWASQAGVVTGYDETTFGPSDVVTREQAATMLYRYVAAQGKDVSGSADLSDYADGAAVSEYAQAAMQWAVAEGVFGVDTDVLRPQDTLTRAEMAAIAVRVQPDGAYTME